MMTGEDEFLAVLRQVYDPEGGINVVDLGLIYGVAQHGDCVHVELNSPRRDARSTMRSAKPSSALAQVRGVARAVVELVWDPPWTPMMITDPGRRGLSWG
jgi:metal-sulfur cluster biosynthetic enzyme